MHRRLRRLPALTAVTIAGVTLAVVGGSPSASGAVAAGSSGPTRTLAARSVAAAPAAAPAATNGLLAYSCYGHAGTGQRGWVVAASTGDGKKFEWWSQGTGDNVPYGGTPQWSPDGTELAHSASYTNADDVAVMLTEANDAADMWDWQASNYEGSAQDSQPTWSADGRYLDYTSVEGGGPQTIHWVNAVGQDTPGDFSPVLSDRSQPWEAPNGDLYYTEPGPSIDVLPAAGGSPTTIRTGQLPQLTPDGTHLTYTHGGSDDAIYESDLDGTNEVMIARYHAGGVITSYSWAADGTQIAFVQDDEVYVEKVPLGTISNIGGYECGMAQDVSWQRVPVAKQQVVRVAGQDRVGTSIAVSKQRFADGTADAVVLADSLQFPDALSGAPLSAKENAPLLLTPPDHLDPRVLAEIGRVLKPGATKVFLLGGPISLSLAVENALTGYSTTRFAGADRYDTSLKVAQYMGTGASAPSELMLATGTDFPDGLSAGAAAGSYWDGTPGAIGGAVLLTKGATMPPATLAYIQAAIAGHTDPDDPVDVSEVGGLAQAAYKDGPNSINLKGQDRYQTSLLVALAHFGSSTVVGVATGLYFPDALSGGAYAAAINAPLLLVPPASLTSFSWTSYYLHAMSGAIGTAYMFGGPLVLPAAEATQLASIIALPGGATIASNPTATAGSLRAAAGAASGTAVPTSAAKAHPSRTAPVSGR